MRPRRRNLPLVASSVALSALTVAAAACSGGGSSDASGADAAGGADGPSSVGPDSPNPTGPSGDGGTTPLGAGDGGDAGDGGTTAPGYDPHVLTGLALWLESTKDVTAPSGGIIAWGDQSGNGNDALLAAGTQPPDFNIPGAAGIGFHGFSTLEIADAPSLQWGTGDFLVEVVASNNYNFLGSATVGTFWSWQDGSYKRYRYGEVYSKIASGFGPGPTIVANDWTDHSYKFIASIDDQDVLRTTEDTERHLLGLRRKGGVLELRKDGSAVVTRNDATVGAADVSSPGTKVYIGGRPNLTHWVGGIWEVIAVKGTVDDAALAGLESYAKRKYGL
jgi:hypothetical protein